jgi:hypothetical protein
MKSIKLGLAFLLATMLMGGGGGVIYLPAAGRNNRPAVLRQPAGKKLSFFALG